MVSSDASEKVSRAWPPARDLFQRDVPLAIDVVQRTAAVEDRILALEAHTVETVSSSQSLHARVSLMETQLGTFEALLAAFEERLQPTPTSARSAPTSAQSLPRENDLWVSPPLILEEPIEAAQAVKAMQLERSLQLLEGEVLALQGELVMLQVRTQMQGVSGSIFSLRAPDMDRKSRSKSCEVLAAKELEMKRLMDRAQEAKASGGVAEFLTELGVRATSAPFGAEQVTSGLIPDQRPDSFHVPMFGFDPRRFRCTMLADPKEGQMFGQSVGRP